MTECDNQKKKGQWKRAVVKCVGAGRAHLSTPSPCPSHLCRSGRRSQASCQLTTAFRGSRRLAAVNWSAVGQNRFALVPRGRVWSEGIAGGVGELDWKLDGGRWEGVDRGGGAGVGGQGGGRGGMGWKRNTCPYLSPFSPLLPLPLPERPLWARLLASRQTATLHHGRPLTLRLRSDMPSADHKEPGRWRPVSPAST